MSVNSEQEVPLLNCDAGAENSAEERRSFGDGLPGQGAAAKRAREPSSHSERSLRLLEPSEATATAVDGRDFARHSDSGPSPKVAASHGFEFGGASSVASNGEASMELGSPPPYTELPTTPVCAEIDDELDAALEEQLAPLIRSALPPPLENEPGAPYSPTQTAPDPEEQYNIISPLLAQIMSAGDIWYLVSSKWYMKWRAYHQRAKHARKALERSSNADEMATQDLQIEGAPGPVDNRPLFTDGTYTKMKVFEEPDVEIEYVTREAWELLTSWFGSHTPAIRRYVITESDTSPGVVELYPPVFTLLRVTNDKWRDHVDPSAIPKVQLSKSNTIGELMGRIKQELDIPQDAEIRLYVGPTAVSPRVASVSPDRMQPTYRVSSDSSKLLWHETSLDRDVRLGVEVRFSDGAHEDGWLVREHRPAANKAVKSTDGNISSDDDATAIGMSAFSQMTSEVESYTSQTSFTVSGSYSSTSYSSTSYSSARYGSYGYGYSVQRKRTGPRGTTGLQNLGNTCFMNSALQCLSNTYNITRFFIDGSYRKDINRDNPLGMQGKIAEAYGCLLDKIWCDDMSSVAPREFKSAIQRFAPQFSGYQQHDSQEFLAFLLDGLHEDLNRVLKKPYVEIPDANGRPDAVVAEERWRMHKMRNDSKVVDEFQGQFKSTLVCPDCNKVSVTFDPFMYLTLPVPVVKQRRLKVTYVPLSPLARPVELTFSVPANSSIRTIKTLIGEEMDADPNKIEVVETMYSSIYHHYQNISPVSQIQANDTIYAYELPCKYPPPPESDYIVFTAIHERRGRYSSSESFGVPMVVALTREDACYYDRIYRALTVAAQRYTTADLFLAVKPEEADTDPEDNAGDAPTDALSTMRVDGEDDKMDETADEQPADIRTDARIRPRRRLFEVTAGRMRQSFSRGGISGPSLGCDHMMGLHNGFTKLQDMDKLVAAAIAKQQEEREARENSGEADVVENETEQLVASANAPDEPSTSADEDEIIVRTPLIETGQVAVLDWNERASNRFYPKSSFYSVSTLAPNNDAFPRTVEGDGTALWTTKERRILPEPQSADNGVLTLKRCLEEFTRAEQLGEEDLWYCPNCKEHRQATKKFDLWRLPNTLVVHLKRFGQSRSWRDKIDDLVDFPLDNLDLTEWVIGEEHGHRPAIYDLYAVSNHFGGMGGGHYTAYGKNFVTGQWFNFDDSSVAQVVKDSIKTRAAYLLFYQRRENDSDAASGVDLNWLEKSSIDTSAADAATDEVASSDYNAAVDTLDDAGESWSTSSTLPTTYGPYNSYSGTWGSSGSSTLVPRSPANWLESDTAYDLGAEEEASSDAESTGVNCDMDEYKPIINESCGSSDGENLADGTVPAGITVSSDTADKELNGTSSDAPNLD